MFMEYNEVPICSETTGLIRKRTTTMSESEEVEIKQRERGRQRERFRDNLFRAPVVGADDNASLSSSLGKQRTMEEKRERKKGIKG